MNHPHNADKILQNRPFKGLDLTGADFSGSDLRGCDFTGATLVGANFTGVKTGLSRRQMNRLVLAAVIAPLGLVGLCVGAVQISTIVLGDRFYQGFDFLLKGLPLLLLFLQIVFGDSVALNFPKTTNLMGIAGISTLFQVMVAFTIFLVIIGISTFGSSGSQGLFLLALAGISTLITRRVFKWVSQSIYSSCGTCFRKANLTDANFSQAVIQNTDFCFAVLTGACIFKWMIQRHTQFAHVDCKYLYLEPAYQKRYPAEGKLLPGESEAYLTAMQAH
jgi:hypothetical protein